MQPFKPGNQTTEHARAWRLEIVGFALLVLGVALSIFGRNVFQFGAGIWDIAASIWILASTNKHYQLGRSAVKAAEFSRRNQLPSPRI